MRARSRCSCAIAQRFGMPIANRGHELLEPVMGAFATGMPMRCSAQPGMTFHDLLRFGVQIIRRAIEEPMRQIVENAGMEGAIVVNKVKEGKDDFGYNAATDQYGNLLAMG